MGLFEVVKWQSGLAINVFLSFNVNSIIMFSCSESTENCCIRLVLFYTIHPPQPGWWHNCNFSAFQIKSNNTQNAHLPQEHSSSSWPSFFLPVLYICHISIRPCQRTPAPIPRFPLEICSRKQFTLAYAKEKCHQQVCGCHWHKWGPSTHPLLSLK